ncbi:hypothetical protein BCR41DRAFT_103729 [Lobosporangium transversale]|uniref:Uncharacterized protein n=1 Tax=Lobosporangium transversale TaxID=64571 RepID=A0A1Y2GIQ0_9FUNG|nr:hypothetical protein BCR41DRAFT_103729 [Lobosporangium transversale]ORZ12052.1 hypothetical protein BCR41DRAFT_103729 [Lobosporangium transversale]|eukprot:XP_021879917.1 hypothetical protein BCR41DRAFT_103729 [Lobosporangium transversale]
MLTALLCLQETYPSKADVVLEVVSTQDPPPTSSRPQNITKTTDIIDSQSAGKDVATSLSSQVNDHATESQYAQTRTSTSSTVASDRRSSDKIQQQQKDEDQLDWTPFQANTLPFQKNTSTLLSEQSQLIRQEVIHWMQLLSAEQEERLEVMLKALRRPAR